MATLKLRAIGNSVGVVLPKELLATLKVGEGDELYAVADRDGVRLSTTDPQFEADMERARAIMKRRRNVLRELAK
jgi:putative addiction module antidote